MPRSSDATRHLLRLAAALAMAAACASATAQGVDIAQRRRVERAQRTDWVLGATLQRAFVPGAPDTTLGIVAADRGALHLEGRWNYEAIDAGTLFAGLNWRRDAAVSVTLVPMLGVAFGSLRGVVPALEASVTWRMLDASIAAEWVRDLDDRSRSFFYAWSELGVSPGGGWRLGAVAQRTRLWETLGEVQRGVFAQVELGPTTWALYVFQRVDAPRRLVLLALSLGD